MEVVEGETLLKRKDVLKNNSLKTNYFASNRDIQASLKKVKQDLQGEAEEATANSLETVPLLLGAMSLAVNTEARRG